MSARVAAAPTVAMPVQPPVAIQASGLQRKCVCGGSAGVTGTCAECQKKQLLGKPLQAKLRINEPSDQYEQEADLVADQVMRMSDAEVARPRRVAGRPLVQRRATSGGAGVMEAPPIVHDVLNSPGQPLDAATRAFFEPRFGHDFSHVRIHADSRGAESARAVNAQAYTVGHHVVFGIGRHNGSPEGDRLLAHELTHVVQQSAAARVPGPSGISSHHPSGDSLSTRFETVGRLSPAVQRACGRSIQAPEVCHPSGDDIDDLVAGPDDLYVFTRDCDDMEPGEEARLLNTARWVLADGDSVDIHGFASEEGDPVYNQALSCARANRVAGLLRTKPLVLTLYQHGATPGERTTRRSVAIEWPRPAPAPAARCITAGDFLGPLAYLAADTAECLCGPIKFLDIFEDLLAKIPGPTRVLSLDSVQTAITGADLLCNAMDFVQLAWQLGQDAEGCWSPGNYGLGDLARLTALAGTIVVDTGAYPAGAKLGKVLSGWLKTMVEEKAAELVVSGGVSGQPYAVGAGLFLGFIVAPAIETVAKNVVEFGFDASTYIAQNYLLAGSPFPLGTCRACARLGHRVKATIDESLCDRWNKAIPEAIRFPSMDSPSPQKEG